MLTFPPSRLSLSTLLLASALAACGGGTGSPLDDPNGAGGSPSEEPDQDDDPRPDPDSRSVRLPAARRRAEVNLTLPLTAPAQVKRSSGKLPEGVSLSADGRLTGVPTSHGTFNFQVRAEESSGKTTLLDVHWEIEVTRWLVYRSTQGDERPLVLVDLTHPEHAKTFLTPKESKVVWHGMTGDGHGLFFVLEEAGELHVHRVDLQADQPAPGPSLATLDGTFRNAVMDPQGTLLALGTLQEDETSPVVLVDLSAEHPVQELLEDGPELKDFDFSPNSRFLYFRSDEDVFFADLTASAPQAEKVGSSTTFLGWVADSCLTFLEGDTVRQVELTAPHEQRNVLNWDLSEHTSLHLSSRHGRAVVQYTIAETHHTHLMTGCGQPAATGTYQNHHTAISLDLAYRVNLAPASTDWELWSAEGRLLVIPDAEHARFSFSPDSRWLLVMTVSGELLVYDLQDLEKEPFSTPMDATSPIAWFHDDARSLTITGINKAEFFRFNNGEPSLVSSVDGYLFGFSISDPWLVRTHSDGHVGVRLEHVQDETVKPQLLAEELFVFPRSTQRLWSWDGIHFALHQTAWPDGTFHDQGIVLWNSETGKVTKELNCDPSCRGASWSFQP
jgi:hypothetical protein